LASALASAGLLGALLSLNVALDDSWQRAAARGGEVAAPQLGLPAGLAQLASVASVSSVGGKAAVIKSGR
jgi:hypothetical protein